MSSLNKFVKPVVNLPLKYDFDKNNEKESVDELNKLLIHKNYKDLKKIKMQSIQKSILFKLLSNNQINSQILTELTQNNELLLGFGSITEYQNKYGELEYQLINVLEKLRDKEDYKKDKLKSTEFNEDDNEDDWGMDDDLDIDLNDEPIIENNIEHKEEEENGDDLNKIELYQLKKKLFSKNYTNNDKNESISSEKENALEEKNHEEMIEELTKLTKALKNNTLEFHNQLETTDKDILSKTETNLMSSGDKLQNLGSKLGKFSKSKLGIFFYLTTIVTMILGLFLTYLVIKIFPEM
ncbi:hypothetical protein HANVADRAFT_50636 [Hanseniaspora valbyensis NRRL Y-1626]|uniref:Uncharacterized protein n=1 Tax=Hanseniaspora valbyensis NRRL Y-1626 TaxID=766949 RepID=A0A1B7T7R3_9ASCO|nr:hypothetical protein HANVADRAFT_50636 [Hanseniaspora valbyensis NRRL Y-1626]